MSLRVRKHLFTTGDSQVLVYAALFLLAAAASALGGGALGLLSFLPAIALAEGASRRHTAPRPACEHEGECHE